MKYKRDFTEEDKKEWAAAKEADLKKAEEMLTSGVKAVYESETYKEWLRFFSGFHQYSFRNSMLIMLQKPEAAYCASYVDWKKKGRSVRKGEKGIKIFVPTPKKFKVKDDETGEEKEVSKMFYKLGTTFDISQTDGTEIPSITMRLTASVDNYDSLLKGIRKVAPCPITFEDINNSEAYGFYSQRENRIVVRAGIPQAHAIKTSIHETAHAILHGKGNPQEKAERNTKELQAESVAYIVCHYLGIDTSDYSFGYVAGWAKDRSGKELEKNLSIISSCAKEIMDALEKEVK